MPKQKELWGRNFNIVKDGLDESEVADYVMSIEQPHNELNKKLEQLDSAISALTDQCREMASKIDDIASIPTASTAYQSEVDEDKMQHLESLTRFAENTIIEAGKYAESVKAGIEDEAKTSANKIIEEAEERALTITRQGREKALDEAMNVKQEVEKLFSKTRQLVQGGIGDMAAQSSDSPISENKQTSSSDADEVKIDCWEVSIAEDPQGQTLFNNESDQAEDQPEGTVQITLAPNSIFSR